MLLTENQIDVLMEPLSTFFQRLSSNNANALDIPQLKYSLKLYIQICRTQGTVDCVSKVIHKVTRFKEKVFKLLENNSKIDTDTLYEVHNLLADIRRVYMKTPISHAELAILKVLGDLADKPLD